MEHIYKTDSQELRDSIYKVFAGKCFYTGQNVRKEDMVIDHIVPKSQGGEDSVYNYVLTTNFINSSKSNKLNRDGVEPILYLVKTVYAPRVLRAIKRLTPQPIKHGGLRKMIYIPNEQIWQEIQGAAKMDGRSVSNYLAMLHQVSARAGDRKAKGFIDESGSISEEVYEKIKPAEDRKEVTSKIQTTLRAHTKNSQLGKKEK